MLRLSPVAFAAARKYPTPMKGALWLWSRALIWWPNSMSERFMNRAFRSLTNSLNYRVPVRTKLGNGMAVTVPWNDACGRAIWQCGYYEPDSVRLVEKLLRPGMVFLDLGANIGQYSLVASRGVGPGGQVHSFEPDPETFRWLTRNVRRNQLTNISLNQVALFDEAGKKELYLATPQDTGSNSFALPWTFSGETCEVCCTRLDEYLKARRIDRVDVVKVDVEGAELPALMGGTEILFKSKHKPLLIVEFEERRQQAFGTSCAALAEFLTKQGYALFRSWAPVAEPYVPGPGNPPSLNVLAIPTNKVASVLDGLR
jgi:FkbM family methyltransferase